MIENLHKSYSSQTQNLKADTTAVKRAREMLEKGLGDELESLKMSSRQLEQENEKLVAQIVRLKKELVASVAAKLENLTLKAALESSKKEPKAALEASKTELEKFRNSVAQSDAGIWKQKYMTEKESSTRASAKLEDMKAQLDGTVKKLVTETKRREGLLRKREEYEAAIRKLEGFEKLKANCLIQRAGLMVC